MNSNIPIKNIYYMLTYAFHILTTREFKNLQVEHFENTEEMFGTVLDKGIKRIVNNSLNRDYVAETELLSVIKGKIDIRQTINTLGCTTKQIVCTYDEYSVNSQLNKIIKSTIYLLLKSNCLSKKLSTSLKQLLVYFKNVDVVDVYRINWNIKFGKNTQTYQMIIGICYLIVHGLLQTTENGEIKLISFTDSVAMSTLYEKFLLEYYRKHYPQLCPAAKVIDWQLDNENKYLLPRMKTDIMLSKGNDVLILDAKFYRHNLQTRFETVTAISGHLYQMFAYVKNKEFELAKNGQPHKVAGMLLYAKTQDKVQPSSDYEMSGNKISVNYLDLSTDFEEIKKTLNSIVEEFFH